VFQDRVITSTVAGTVWKSSEVDIHFSVNCTLEARMTQTSVIRFPKSACLITVRILGLHNESLAQLVEALPYKPEGRGFDSRWYHWNFSLT
jgi:hypothetical protein